MNPRRLERRDKGRRSEDNSSELNRPVSADYERNVREINRELGVPDNFDVVLREIVLDGKRVAIYSLNGLVNEQVSSMLVQALLDLESAELLSATLERLVAAHIGTLQVSYVETLDKFYYFLLSGPLAIIVEGEERAIIVDLRVYPGRSPEEPDLERVTRGARDGFTESLVTNTALIRRRLRDPKLRLHMAQVGSRSKMDVCLLYIEDITNLDLVRSIQEEIQKIKIDGIPMAEKSVEEFILGSKPWNPYPRVRYTERPDVAAIHLLEGHVVIVADTSPSVMIAPATFWHHTQHAEEYRQEPVVGAFLRLIRFWGIFISVFLTPVWLAAALNPQFLPDALGWLNGQNPAKIGLFWQVLLADLGVDLVRMAAIHTPSPLATALGLIAAFMIGDVAIDVGLFAPEVILITAFAAVGTFATPSYEFSLANKLVRLFLIIMTGLGNFIGLGIGTLAVFVMLVCTKSFDVPYLWPFIPLDLQALAMIIFRSPVPIKNKRPKILKPQDETRQPDGDGE